MKYDVLLLDALNVYHRAGFSFDLSVWDGSDEYQTGAVFGFYRIAMKFWDSYAAPGAKLIVCWDAGYDHRVAMYPDYKVSRRKPLPPEGTEEHQEALDGRNSFRFQKKALRELLRLSGWSNARAPGFEADDVLATLAARESASGKRVAISTTDRDLHQVVSDRVHVIAKGPKGEKVWDPKAVEAAWGFPPDRVAELKALQGDGGDDIPGCPGCGAGWARKFLQAYGDLDGILKAAAEEDILTGEWQGKSWRSKALAGKLRDNAELVRISHGLAKVVCDCPVVITRENPQREELIKKMSSLAFHSLIDERNMNRILEISGEIEQEQEQDPLSLFGL